MTQTKEELEEFYANTDPWAYTSTPDDELRKWHIYSALPYKFKRILDIGAGEGFITSAFKNRADSIEAIEISDNAAKRLPDYIKRVKKPTGKYDLIIATGVLYEQYNWEQMRKWIEEHADGFVITSHYDEMVAYDVFDKPQILTAQFLYRKGNQVLRVYRWQ